MTQYLEDTVGIQHGNGRKWRVALVAPDGQILTSQSLGYSSTDIALSSVLSQIASEIKDSTWSGKDLFLMDPGQMLGLAELRRWHNFRLAWGEGDPEARFSECPNGVDLHWNFYYCANGRCELITSGRLPEGWWKWDEEERWHYKENSQHE